MYKGKESKSIQFRAGRVRIKEQVLDEKKSPLSELANELHIFQLSLMCVGR